MRLCVVELPEFGSVTKMFVPAVVSVSETVMKSLAERPLAGLLKSFNGDYPTDKTFQEKKRVMSPVGASREAACTRILDGAFPAKLQRKGVNVKDDAPAPFKKRVTDSEIYAHEIGATTSWSPSALPYVIFRVHGEATYVMSSAESLEEQGAKMVPPCTIAGASTQTLAAVLKVQPSAYEVRVKEGQCLYIPPGFCFTEKRSRVGVTIRCSGFPARHHEEEDPMTAEETLLLQSMKILAPAFDKNVTFQHALDLLEAAPKPAAAAKAAATS